MVLSFTFYKNNTNLEEKKSDKPPEERIYLQTAIADHVIWKTLDFWECSIFESMKEELENQRNLPGIKTERLNEILIREKSTIFSQLASYAHNMMIFGMDGAQVKELMTKFGKSYNLYDLQIKDLYVNLKNKICFIFFIQINVENFGKDPESMAKMKAMGLTFLYNKDPDVKKKTEVTKMLPGGLVNKRTLNFGVLLYFFISISMLFNKKYQYQASANNPLDSLRQPVMGFNPLPIAQTISTSPHPNPNEEEREQKNKFLTPSTTPIPAKVEFKSDYVGKTTHIKFEEKKPDFKSEFEHKPEEKSFELNVNRGMKKTSFYHENEDIMSESGNLKKFMKSYESNL